MAGEEKKLGVEGWKSNNKDGIIPRSVDYMWSQMTYRNEQFYVKASFAEIYKEQIQDLLNPASGILHCRWNVQNGFFVEDLTVVECTCKEDLIAVLHEGIKNRKTGSHNLNTDSSRSHSLLTIYLISETKNDNDIYKKYGKISFVDLAGSERLKETESKGEMLKETGNINKSLFTLGKVISCLSDKRGYSGKHIPYRDSKLTMLLMDSLGGSSKALMIACISPSDAYSDETLSTLNYATRTMNIKNKPVIKMDAKEQIKFNLKREVQLLLLQNQFLRQEYIKLTGDPNIQIPEIEELQRLVGGQAGIEGNLLPMISGNRNAAGASQSFDPKNGTDKSGKKFGAGGNNGQSGFSMMQKDYQREIKGEDELQKLDFKLNQLRQENAQMRYQRELMGREFESMLFENTNLNKKLANLEKVFIGESVSAEMNAEHDPNESDSSSSSNKRYSHGLLVSENNELRARIESAEQNKIELKGHLIKLEAEYSPMDGQTRDTSRDLSPTSLKRILQLNETNSGLEEKIKLLQSREQQLTEQLLEGYPKPSSSSSKKSTNSSYMRFKRSMTNNN